MAFQSALSNDWHLTSIAGVSYLGVTTDHLQHVQFAEGRGRARRQFFCHRIALSKALTNIFSDEPPSKGFVVCGTNRHRRHQWRPLTCNQGTQSLFPDTIWFQWNSDWTLDCSLIRRARFAPRNFVEKLLEQVAQRDCRSWFAIGIERHGAIAFAINLPPDDLRRREAGRSAFCLLLAQSGHSPCVSKKQHRP